MNQVTVHRCVLRILRTAGWSWGPSSDALLDAASRALPALVASQLPALAATAVQPVDVAAPVRIRVETTLAELVALAAQTPEAEATGARAPSALEQRIGAALGAALAARLALPPSSFAPSSTEPAPSLSSTEPTLAVGQGNPRDAVSTMLDVSGASDASGAMRPRAAAWRVLRAWATRGAAERVLADLAPVAVAALHDLVLAPPGLPMLAGSPREPSPGPSGHMTGAAASAAIAALRARLALAATITARDATLSAAQLRAMVDASVPAPPGDVVRAAISQATPEPLSALAAAPATPRSLSGVASLPPSPPGAVPAPVPLPPPGAVMSPRPASPSGAATAPDASSLRSTVARSEALPSRVPELELRSALPFLILPALHHAGWLDTAAILLDTQGLTGDGVALAAALAGKLLDPPERGWMRTRDDRAIIAAFAGSDTPIADDQLAAAAERLAPVLGVLDDSLRAVLRDARRSGAPVVLWRGACGWSALDSDGFAVLAAAPALAAVLASVAALGEPLVVVPAACADPATLDRIDLANLRFVTDAPPGRSEPWRALAGGGRALWTNDTATPAGKLAATVADLASLTALAGELTSELDARPALARTSSPALARTPSPALDATATLAVTAALADLSARLFPDEPATPILALSRFRDLDARVRFEPDCIRVRVPLGRRHADLMRHGLLTTIPRVPWLGGRCVDLGGA